MRLVPFTLRGHFLAADKLPVRYLVPGTVRKLIARRFQPNSWFRFLDLYNALLPPSLLEHDRTHDGQGRKRNRHGPEDSMWAKAERLRKRVAQRYFPEPEGEKVYDRRGPRIACAVE